MAEIGEMAGQNALYWQGGVWAFEATTGSRLLIEQHMIGPWQGEIRAATQRGEAAALLDNVIVRLERAQASLGLQSVAVERSTIVATTPEPVPMQMRQEKPKEPEWYVSYAWRDDKTPEGQAREELVDKLCSEAEARDIHILRDKRDVRVGDSISDFMRRIGTGDRVFVFLSDKYLHSPFCMYELLELWRTSKQDSATLRDRIRVYTLDDADIWQPLSRLQVAAYWKKEYDKIDAFVHDNGGTSILGERDFEAYKRIGDFYRDVGNILATLADIVQPRTFEDLKRYGLD
jgi:internalin A